MLDMMFNMSFLDKRALAHFVKFPSLFLRRNPPVFVKGKGEMKTFFFPDLTKKNAVNEVRERLEELVNTTMEDLGQ